MMYKSICRRAMDVFFANPLPIIFGGMLLALETYLTTDSLEGFAGFALGNLWIFLLPLAVSLISGALVVGAANFFLRAYREGKADWSDFFVFFTSFKRFLNATLLAILPGVIAVVAIILLTIGSILLGPIGILVIFIGAIFIVIFMFRFAAAPYVMACDHDCGPVECLEKSAMFMSGKVWSMIWFYVVVLCLPVLVYALLTPIIFFILPDFIVMVFSAIVSVCYSAFIYLALAGFYDSIIPPLFGKPFSPTNDSMSRQPADVDVYAAVRPDTKDNG